MDESIGYYKDLYAMFKEVIVDALNHNDPYTAQEQIEYLVDIQEHEDYDDLLVCSMNNGMGFTCTPYRKEK